jgi:hypothetical protein
MYGKLCFGINREYKAMEANEEGASLYGIVAEQV